MRPFAYQILTSNIELTKLAINYFLAEVIDPILFKDIQRIAFEWHSKMNRVTNPNIEIVIKLGYFSLNDFLMYLTEKKLVENGVKTDIIDELLKVLEVYKILILVPDNFHNISEKRYKANGLYSKQLYEKDLILNLVCGWKYIIDKYKSSVYKIEHEKFNGDKFIGTGFYCFNHLEYMVILTNKHVVLNAKSIKVFDINDNHIDFISISYDNNRDLGFIILKDIIDNPIFCLNDENEVLSEILTIGYPSVPMTKYSYQIYHRGEINSFVEDYNNNKLFLFSAKTSSGNSGGPIIDLKGTVIGIVTEELFEQEAFQLKGKLPYYAGIPTSEIIKSIKENLSNEL